MAVQLLEQKNTLDLESAKFVAEQVKGTFNFTILDRTNRMYFIKGNNPLCLYYFKQAGFYLYASTKAILEDAMKAMGYYDLPHEEIRIQDGEILLMDEEGKMTWEQFAAPVSYSSYYLYDFWEPIKTEPTGYRKYMLSFGESMGIPKAELDWLHQMGYSTYDIEEAIFSPNYRTMCLMESGYYDDMEDDIYGYDSLRSYAWA